MLYLTDLLGCISCSCVCLIEWNFVSYIFCCMLNKTAAYMTGCLCCQISEATQCIASKEFLQCAGC